jgi:hypothetical protein
MGIRTPEVPSLVVRVDGDAHAVVPLRDGDDVFNAEAERGALDRAYEAKESCPECAVEIVVLTVAAGDAASRAPSNGEPRVALEDLLAAYKADPQPETMLPLTEAIGAYYRRAHGL